MSLLRRFFSRPLSIAHGSRGSGYLAGGKCTEAIAEYSKAIQFDPSDGEANLQRALAYGEISQHDQAIADCTEAIKRNPGFAKAYCWRGANLFLFRGVAR